mmetsp:Transcript_32055/g.55295  ORF Transcript_32055/g.55295 Transcript_32055/m.55295 type:complete len:568 (+) Transcript_32055:38-1741(+)
MKAEELWISGDRDAILRLHSNFVTRLQMFQNQGEDVQDTYDSDMKQICEFSSKLVGIFEGLFTVHRRKDFFEMFAIYSFIDCFYIQKNHALTLTRLLNYEKLPDVIDEFWPQFFEILKRGNLEDAKKCLKNHPKCSGNFKFFKELEKHLEVRFRFFAYPDFLRTEHDFVTKFEELKRDAVKLTAATQSENLREFSTLTLLLEGRLDQVTEDWVLDWKEYLLMHILFVDGIYHGSSNVIKNIMRRFGDQLNDFDHLLIGFAQFETLHSSLQNCRSKYPKYFVAHIVESLIMIYAIPIEPLDVLQDLTYPESFFKDYVEEIIQFDEIGFEIPCDYIINTLGRLPEPQKMIEDAFAVRLGSEKNFSKSTLIARNMLDYCKANQIAICNEFIYKFMYSINNEHHNLIEAFTWGCNSSDKKFTDHISQELLEQASSMDISALKELASELPESVGKKSGEAFFLRKYTEFRTLLDENTSESLNQAATLMHEFLVLRVAPQLFWSKIIEEGLKLFQQDNYGFAWNDLMTILERVETLSNPQICSSKVSIDTYKISRVLTQAIVKSQIGNFLRQS